MTPEFRKHLQAAVAYGIAAEEARENDKPAKATHYDAKFESHVSQLGNETVELIRECKAELAK